MPGLYWRHSAWLEDGLLLREANRLSGIPGVLIHGSLDLGGPLVTQEQNLQVPQLLSRCTKLGDLENKDRVVALNWETQQTNCT
jgi:hypothetical protein